MKEYNVIIVTEGALGSIFLGESKLSETTLTAALNEQARQGWEMEFMVVEQRRLYLFWHRDAAIISFSKMVQ